MSKSKRRELQGLAGLHLALSARIRLISPRPRQKTDASTWSPVSSVPEARRVGPKSRTEAQDLPEQGSACLLCGALSH